MDKIKNRKKQFWYKASSGLKIINLLFTQVHTSVFI
jgi:hypothetical protein